MKRSIIYWTPYDRPSRRRYVLLAMVVFVLTASATHHGELRHDTRPTGYTVPHSEGYTSAYWAGSDRYFPNLANYLEAEDPSLQLYREPVTREAVIDFFVSVVGSEEIVVPVLKNADRNDIPPTLAFTIAYIESSYRTHVVNQNTPNSHNRRPSTDRGLFQLNDRSFPHLSDDDFFHPDTNSQYAMEHLRYAMNRAGEDYQTAIAIYNAGEGRVLAGNTPASTQRYVRRASQYRASLLSRFRAFIDRHFPTEPREIAGS